MTTKPRVKRFRVRQGNAAPVEAAPEVVNVTPVPQPMRPPGDKAGPPAKRAPTEPAGDPAEAIDAIRREGLTGRQLRMARRVAQKQGLEPASDYDAVRLLRERGIDPFKRSNTLELVVSDPKSVPAMQMPSGPSALPSTVVSEPAPAPSTQFKSGQVRTDDIITIQRDIARRRRKRAWLLAARLLFFVMIPTIVAGYYYYKVATPMFATKSEFVIQSADSAGAQMGGGLLSGTGLANSRDAIAVQGYLQSRDALLRLDQDEDFKAHFSHPDVDVLQRIEADSTNEEAYRLFRKHVKIGFDPSEGIIKMEVIAADPAASARFSEKLIAYAEDQVDQLTARMRGDQMEGAEASRQEANDKMIAAQDRIVELQERLGVLSPESEVQAIFGQITQLESELLTERLSLRSFLTNRRPNEARVRASENKISELESLIAEKRGQLTQSTSDSGSLARVSGELLVAQAELETRQALLAQAESQFEAARLEANRQVRYLSVGVSPIAPDEPTYPRAFENTILAFLIFAGIYLMISLTASILREQV